MGNKTEVFIKFSEKGAKSISAGIGRLNVDLGDLSSKVFNVRNALVGLGVGYVGAQFLEAADTSEQFATRLAGLLGSVEEGNRLFDSMADYASRVPHQYEEIMSSATALSGVMKGGVGEIEQWMPIIGDLAAAYGMSIEETTSQVVRMYSAGAASADMFRERGVLAALDFQAGVSYSAEETRKKLIAAYEDPLSSFKGASADLAEDWSGLTSMMGDKWFSVRNLVMDAGPFEFLKRSLKEVNDFLTQNSAQTEELAQWLGVAVTEALAMVANGVGWVVEGFSGLNVVWQVLKYGFYSFQEFIWEGLHLVRTAITDVIESVNFNGIFDDALAESKRIAAEQGLILRVIALDKEAALVAGANALDMHDKIVSKVDQYREAVERVKQAALSGFGVQEDVDPTAPTGLQNAGADSGSASLGKDQMRLQEQLEKMALQLEGEEAMLEDSHQRRMAMVDNAAEQGLVSEARARELALKIEEDYLKKLIKLRVKGMSDLEKFTAMSYKDQTTTVLGEMINMTQGVASSSRAMFEINKGARIAMAGVELIFGTIKTFNTYPYPWNLAMTALHVATGIAQISQLSSASYGGSAAAPTIGNGAGTPTSPIVTDPQPSSAREDMAMKQEIHVNFPPGATVIMGTPEEFARRMAPELRLAANDGA